MSAYHSLVRVDHVVAGGPGEFSGNAGLAAQIPNLESPVVTPAHNPRCVTEKLCRHHFSRMPRQSVTETAVVNCPDPSLHTVRINK